MVNIENTNAAKYKNVLSQKRGKRLLFLWQLKRSMTICEKYKLSSYKNECQGVLLLLESRRAGKEENGAIKKISCRHWPRLDHLPPNQGCDRPQITDWVRGREHVAQSPAPLWQLTQVGCNECPIGVVVLKPHTPPLCRRPAQRIKGPFMYPSAPKIDQLLPCSLHWRPKTLQRTGIGQKNASAANPTES